MKGVLPCLVRWTCRAGTRDFCSALAHLVGPSSKYFFLTIHYSIHLFPSPTKLARLVCVSVSDIRCVSLFVVCYVCNGGGGDAENRKNLGD
jgi:hypothetical protein